MAKRRAWESAAWVGLGGVAAERRCGLLFGTHQAARALLQRPLLLLHIIRHTPHSCGVLTTLEPQPKKMRAALNSFMLATDLSEYHSIA